MKLDERISVDVHFLPQYASQDKLSGHNVNPLGDCCLADVLVVLTGDHHRLVGGLLRHGSQPLRNKTHKATAGRSHGYGHMEHTTGNGNKACVITRPHAGEVTWGAQQATVML